jgi:hypothetical protein
LNNRDGRGKKEERSKEEGRRKKGQMLQLLAPDFRIKMEMNS